MTADPSCPEGYPTPYNITFSNKSCGEKRRKGEGTFRDMRLSSQVTIRHNGALLSWRWLNICLGNNGRIPSFALLLCLVFALPVELSLSHPMSSCTFTLLIPSAIPLVGSQ